MQNIWDEVLVSHLITVNRRDWALQRLPKQAGVAIGRCFEVGMSMRKDSHDASLLAFSVSWTGYGRSRPPQETFRRKRYRQQAM